MAAVIALTFVAPYVFLPLFFKPKPVDDPGVVMMIEDLVRQAGTTVAGVSQLDFSRRTHEANAAVIGFGRSRRVVLADTLLDSFTPSEIKAVVAHELGHHVHRDVPKLLAVQAVVMALGLGLAAAVGEPLLRLFGAAPLGRSGRLPAADRSASASSAWSACRPSTPSRARSRPTPTPTRIGLVGDGRPLAAAMRRLADQNLAEERPPRWAEILLYTHPPIWRRVAARGGRTVMARVHAPSWIGPGLAVLFVVPLLVYGAYSIGDRWYQNYLLTQQEEAIRAEVMRLREENLRLQRDLVIARSDAGIEKAAREQPGPDQARRHVDPDRRTRAVPPRRPLARREPPRPSLLPSRSRPRGATRLAPLPRWPLRTLTSSRRSAAR